LSLGRLYASKHLAGRDRVSCIDENMRKLAFAFGRHQNLGLWDDISRDRKRLDEA
jgi:hypothetical protein